MSQSEQKFSEMDEYKLMTLMDKALKRKASVDELKDFVGLLCKFTKVTNYLGDESPLPIIEFDNLGKYRSGEYNGSNNSITITQDYVKEFTRKKLFLKDSDKLFDFIMTIGHEMKHYSQNNASKKFNFLPEEQKNLIDQAILDSINSYQYDFKLDKDELKSMHDMFAPYLKDAEIPQGYSSIDLFYEDVSYATYYTQLIEREARDAGTVLGKQILDLVQNSKFANKDLKKWASLNTYQISFNNKWNEKLFSEENEILKKFESKFSTSMQTILKFVDEMETSMSIFNDGPNSNGENKLFIYRRVLEVLLKDKTLEQKQELLKNAIFNGNIVFLDCLNTAIMRDPKYKENKLQIGEFTAGCLMGNGYGSKDDIDLKSYYYDYSTLLTNEQYNNVIRSCLKGSNFRHAKNLISYSERKFNFSAEDMLQFAAQVPINYNTDRPKSQKEEWQVIDLKAFYNSAISIMSPDEILILAKNEKIKNYPQLLTIVQVELKYCLKRWSGSMETEVQKIINEIDGQKSIEPDENLSSNDIKVEKVSADEIRKNGYYDERTNNQVSENQNNKKLEKQEADKLEKPEERTND